MCIIMLCNNTLTISYTFTAQLTAIYCTKIIRIQLRKVLEIVCTVTHTF